MCEHKLEQQKTNRSIKDGSRRENLHRIVCYKAPLSTEEIKNI